MSKDNNFFKGAAILSIAGILVKILGAIYRIPLTNIIGDEGMGYYQTAYPFYQLLLTLSTSGFPVAVAKLVSEKRALGDYRSAYKVFKVAFLGLLIGGVLSSLFIFLGAEKIVESVGNSKAYYSLIALVPALFFVPIMSSFRGFFQGQKTMVPTAISQIAEQLVRVVVGLSLTVVLLDKGVPIAAGGASFGGSAGAMAGMIAIFLVYIKRKTSIKDEIRLSTVNYEYRVSRIVKDLLMIAIPITIGSAIVPIMDTIDTALVFQRLQVIGYSEKVANDLYGQLKGMAQTLINLPMVFSVSIAMSMVPAISDAYARKSRSEIKDLISSGIRITLLIGLPAALGLFVLSTPVIKLLYYTRSAETIESTGGILAVLSFSVIFLTLVQTLTAMLQGIGKTFVPVRNLAIGAVVKIGLTYVLTAIPAINIRGAAISTVITYAIASLLDLYSIVSITKLKLDYKNIIFKPLISSIGMAIVVRIGYVVVAGITGNTLATVAGVIAGVIAYGVLLVITGTLTKEDYASMPMGDKIVKKLESFKIIK